MRNICLVSWPSAPLTERLVLKSLQALHTPVEIITSVPNSVSDQLLIQWSSYDAIDHELTHLHRQKVLSSSYTFRKALIRKHFLSRCILSYVTKRSTSFLRVAMPQTYEIEISFADELDEMWADDLWELGEALKASNSWWILKPGMSDRGMGIRLFNSKASLQDIFEEFEDIDSEDEDEDPNNNNGTAVMTSQLRHFVVQEYITNPLLFDPFDVDLHGSTNTRNSRGYKFHLRAYCFASGAIQVYLYDRILALFSAVPYAEPVANEEDNGRIGLEPHLTNTSLQAHNVEEGVRLLDELIGLRSLPLAGEGTEFTLKDVADIKRQMADILAETFKAALDSPIHFQPLPNAFELYGIDFLVACTHVSLPKTTSYQVKLLEINAEPAIELTGPRLTWILEDLFVSIGKICVEPFLAGTQSERGRDVWSVGDTRDHLVKCLDEGVRIE